MNIIHRLLPVENKMTIDEDARGVCVVPDVAIHLGCSKTPEQLDHLTGVNAF